jgi:hypothetical protein
MKHLSADGQWYVCKVQKGFPFSHDLDAVGSWLVHKKGADGIMRSVDVRNPRELLAAPILYELFEAPPDTRFSVKRDGRVVLAVLPHVLTDDALLRGESHATYNILSPTPADILVLRHNGTDQSSAVMAAKEIHHGTGCYVVVFGPGSDLEIAGSQKPDLEAWVKTLACDSRADMLDQMKQATPGVWLKTATILEVAFKLRDENEVYKRAMAMLTEAQNSMVRQEAEVKSFEWNLWAEIKPTLWQLENMPSRIEWHESADKKWRAIIHDHGKSFILQTPDGEGGWKPATSLPYRPHELFNLPEGIRFAVWDEATKEWKVP